MAPACVAVYIVWNVVSYLEGRTLIIEFDNEVFWEITERGTLN